MAYRIIDVVGALLGLGLTAPVMLLAALAIRLTMGPPVIFRQQRLGRNDVPFTLLKLRTMVTEERSETGQVLPVSQRLTRVGRWLRYLSIDEFPQFWNVLRGDMSLVGPRPLFVEYLPYYTERERKRHQVRPGITGLAQVEGRNSLDWKDRLELDVRYVEAKSLWLDLWILWRTIGRVLRRRDVHDEAVQGSLVEHRAGRSSDGAEESRTRA